MNKVPMTEHKQYENLNNEADKLSASFSYCINVSISKRHPWLFVINIYNKNIFKGCYKDCMNLLQKLKKSMDLKGE